jgi:transposase-like protein
MNDQKRKNRTPEEKVSILRRHLIEKVPVSNLCEEYGLHPTVFYRWLKQFFENGAAALQNHRPDSGRQRDQEHIAALEMSLQAKNEVLAELMEEHVASKKVLGRAD